MNQSILYIGTYSSPIMMGTGELYRGKGNGIHSLLFSQGKGTFFFRPFRYPIRESILSSLFRQPEIFVYRE